MSVEQMTDRRMFLFKIYFLAEKITQSSADLTDKQSYTGREKFYSVLGTQEAEPTLSLMGSADSSVKILIESG